MALPVTIPYTFGTATTSIPLSQLDTDFSTVVTALNGVSDGTSPLANVSIIGGNISGLANPITVSSGGTGYNSLTANSLLAGNGNSAVQLISPGTVGNILYSTGTAWTSTAFIPQPGASGNLITSNGTAWISQAGGLPAQTSNVAGTVLKTSGSTASWATALNLGTSVASTSGTAIDFTSIPSWVKRVTVMLAGVSTNGSSVYLIQIGSGSVLTSGYNSTSMIAGGSNAVNGVGPYTAGFALFNNSSASIYDTVVTLVNISGNLWVMGATISPVGTAYAGASGGKVTLSGSLDRVRITTVSGDTFDAGTINIMWE